MKMNEKQMQRMAKRILGELKAQDVIRFKVDETKVQSKVIEVIKQNIRDEQALDNLVNTMMDDLERKHSGEFQRYLMFPMLKKKLAKEKGFIL